MLRKPTIDKNNPTIQLNNDDMYCIWRTRALLLKSCVGTTTIAEIVSWALAEDYIIKARCDHFPGDLEIEETKRVYAEIGWEEQE